MKKTMTAGALASAAGIGRETIRYYERKGILPKPQLNGSGYRIYSTETLRELNFLKSHRM